MTHIDTMKLALEALVSSRVFVTTREKIKHPEGTEWYDERITALRLAIEQADCGCADQIDCHGRCCVRAERREPVCETTAWAQAFGAGVKAGRTYLSAKEQEPVAWMYPDDLERFQTNETFAQAYSIKVVSPTHGDTVPLYNAPPKRQPLTDEGIIEHFKALVRTGSLLSFADGVRYAERAHGIGGDK